MCLYKLSNFRGKQRSISFTIFLCCAKDKELAISLNCFFYKWEDSHEITSDAFFEVSDFSFFVEYTFSKFNKLFNFNRSKFRDVALTTEPLAYLYDVWESGTHTKHLNFLLFVQIQKLYLCKESFKMMTTWVLAKQMQLIDYNCLESWNIVGFRTI